MEKENIFKKGITSLVANVKSIGNCFKAGESWAYGKSCSQLSEEAFVDPNDPEYLCEVSLKNMIENAKNIEDLNAIGAKLNEAIDKKYNFDIMDYQFNAAKKMTEIYNELAKCRGY
jgi:hypothetical protein